MWCLQSAILCAITTKTTNHKLQTPTPKYRLNKPQNTDLIFTYYSKCYLLTISMDLGAKLVLDLAVDTSGIWREVAGSVKPECVQRRFQSSLPFA